MVKKSLRDPNAPKRNMSAYLLYQNGMRNQFRAQNPGMTFGQLAKYTSAMYAEMSPHEKQAWSDRAEADKARYLHELASYVPPPGFDAKGDAIMSTQSLYSKKRGKTERDPNAPKRNMSAYLLYQNAMRNQFKQENPGMTFGQLAKYTSHMYKNLTPDEKQTWVDRAEQDKARYEAQITVYVPPPGHDAHGNLINTTHGKRQKRTHKDPDAPKRARGSFVFFTFEMRPKVVAEFPGIKFVDMGTVLGQRWRALTPEEKKRFEDMAAEDKVRFHVEMQKYTAELNLAEAQRQAQVLQQQAQMIAQPSPNIVPSDVLSGDTNQHQMLQQQYYVTTADPTQTLSYAPDDPTQLQHMQHMQLMSHSDQHTEQNQEHMQHSEHEMHHIDQQTHHVDNHVSQIDQQAFFEAQSYHT